MKINILRGQNQIGGSIIEVASDTTRIILDAGSELEEKDPAAPSIEGLFSGKASYDAAFISHYHGDHIGLCEKILPEIPVYIGKAAGEVTDAARTYLRKPKYRFAGHYDSGKPFIVGDMVVTPYLCDHSAFDAYMFHIACNGKFLLYTGDFRSHGRKSFDALLKRLPSVDVLITEGTTLSRTQTTPIPEEELEHESARLVAQTDGPVFVMTAATNIDRLVSMYKTAIHTKRVLLQDLYLAAVSTAAGGNIPNPKGFSGIRVFLTNGASDRYTQLQSYGEAKIGRRSIAMLKFVMCVRPSMQAYLEKLSSLMSFENGVLFYSLWEGYKEKEAMAVFISFMQGKGVKVISLHTSGHADSGAIDALIKKVQPSTIIPVHTENSNWFERYEDITIVKDQAFSF
jgi:ribonuclease J